MSTRGAAWLAWSVWVLSVALGISSLVLQTLNDPVTFLGNVFELLVLLAFATVGALIASRRPDNRIGWILSVGTCLGAAGSTALEYGVYTLFTVPGSFPGGDWMAWYGFFVNGLGFSLIITFLPLLFPDGRLLSGRWRSVAWLAAGGLVFFTILSVFGPSSTEYRLASVNNPLGIQLPADFFDLLLGLYVFTFGATTIVCAASVFFRFRRATGDERQQLKWFAYAAGLGVIVIWAIGAVNVWLPPSFATEFGPVLFSLAVAGFPIAVGIAILRYRLYDIDLIIRRTLIYGGLSVVLALVYFGGWRPVGVLGGALLFSLVNALQLWMQVLGVNIPSNVAVMLPYLLTIAALAVAVNRARQPAALNKPFERGEG